MKSRKIQKAWREGKRVIEEVLGVVDTEELAHTLEVTLIQKYGRRDVGSGILCNHTDGGEGSVGLKHTTESKQLMAKAKRGNTINAGRSRPDFAEKWKKPITMFTDGGIVVKHYASSIECVMDTNIHKATISDCLRGKLNTAKSPTGEVYQFRYGIIEDPIPAVLRKQHRGIGTVLQKTKTGDIISIFRNSKEAERVTGISGSSIRNCIHGKAKTAGGFCWELQ